MIFDTFLTYFLILTNFDYLNRPKINYKNYFGLSHDMYNPNHLANRALSRLLGMCGDNTNPLCKKEPNKNQTIAKNCLKIAYITHAYIQYSLYDP